MDVSKGHKIQSGNSEKGEEKIPNTISRNEKKNNQSTANIVEKQKEVKGM